MRGFCVVLLCAGCGSVANPPDGGGDDGPSPDANVDARPPCNGSMMLTFTGAMQTVAVPSCAARTTIETWGAQGGNGLTGGIGGRGAYVRGTFTNLAGMQL